MRSIIIAAMLLALSTFTFGAELKRFNGNVTVNGEQPVKGQMLALGDVLVANGKSSFFLVQYKDGSRFMIKNGELKVEKLDQKKKVSLYHLVKGGLFLFINPKSNRDFGIKTKNVSMAVRGTKFWIKETEEESYLCVCDGIVETSNSAGTKLVKDNQDVRIRDYNAPIEVTIPSEQMWKLALEGLKELGVEVDSRR